MIDISKIKYRLVIMTEDGKQYDVKDYISKLGWEENKRELAARITFTAMNSKTSAGLLSSLAKLGCLVGIFAECDGSQTEVARGYIVDWKPNTSGSNESFDCTCYDELYNLQQSQDNIYYSAGTGTKSAICRIFDDWKIPMDRYEGPDVSHAKLVYKAKKLSETMLDILDDAEKKGGDSCTIRAEKGKISVLPKGSNKTVYHFEADNTKMSSHKMSTSGMVTRVKVIGQEDDDGKTSVEATLDGETKYGIRQNIVTRQKDNSLDEAKSAARDILDEKGKVQENISVQAPDIPFIRKSDLVHLKLGTLDGYYYVEGIRHNADSASMTMDLEKAVTKRVTEQAAASKSYNVGDIVNFHGGTHYVSSYPDAKGYNARAGRAKITIKNGSGKTHPWHLIHVDAASNVYGWVNEGTFD